MKTSMKKWNRILAQVLVVAMLLCAIPVVASAAELPQSQATFTFSDQAIAGTGAVLANEIAGTTLTIKQSGVYTVNGSCAEGNIVIAKGVTGVTLVLDNFKLVSAKGAPISVEANAELKLFLVGTNALENKAVRPAKAAAPAEGAAATAEATAAADKTAKKAPAFVGAAIKVKSNAKLVITGEGTLFLNSTVKTPISCAKNAKATIKGNALNFKAKKAEKKAAAPAPAPVETPVAETPVETPVVAPVEETAAPVEETTAPAADAVEAAPVVENAETEEGAAATVNAAKKNNKNNKNFKNNKAQKNRKNNAKKVKPLEIKAGANLTVKDAEGNVVFTAVAPIDAKQVIIVSEKLTAKKAYTLFDGETQISKATARASQNLVANTNNKKNNKKNNKNNKANKANKNNKNNRNNWNNKFGKMPGRFNKNAKQAQPAAAPTPAPAA